MVDVMVGRPTLTLSAHLGQHRNNSLNQLFTAIEVGCRRKAGYTLTFPAASDIFREMDIATRLN
jgi:hypothetical protein